MFGLVWLGCVLYAIAFCTYYAWKIRMRAIDDVGSVIHEFDPYFNYRATEYLYEHGSKKFFTWFDYMVWYPLGRPVGSTIYPGMQFTAVYLKRYLFPETWTLNDVCCYMPTWFGAFASMIVGCIAYETTLAQNTNMHIGTWIIDIVKGRRTNPPVKPTATNVIGGFQSPSVEIGIFAMGLMAVVPAHLMRSVGGGFDNESVAVSAMTMTFYLWVRSLRNDAPLSWVFGILAGFAYFYMVAAWGGYVFVINIIGVHAAFLVLAGRFSTKCYLSYTLFYAIGTCLAIQVPVVGWAPLKSLEQLGPGLVFLGYQALQFVEVMKRKHKLSRMQTWKLRIQVGLVGLLIIVALVMVVAPSGYFGPISSRVRGLFVKHTKTGNPLVDSVAEHQPASSKAYYQYLHNICLLAPLGFLSVMVNLSDASSFLLVYGTFAYFFSHKMVRLILLTACIGSTLGGIALGRMFVWCMTQLWGGPFGVSVASTTTRTTAIPTASLVDPTTKSKKTKKSKRNQVVHEKSSFEGFAKLKEAVDTASNSSEGIIVKRTVSVILLIVMYISAGSFTRYCWSLSQSLSNPTIIQKGRTRDGGMVTIDDYREAYWWLRDNTPEDSRIMAWWDYGYQITAIANRTTIADGNTWNHEHIALLGKTLTTDMDEGYEIARHMADYVLVWGGGGGDDLAKSPHLARIANSVYREHCPGDPTCRAFGFVDRNGTPSPMMERSFLYRLHGHKIKPGVEADPSKFQEMFRSKYGKVRIFKLLGVSQESKEWVKDPKNRVCDVPGSWFCPGQYPPALQYMLDQKKDFAQLEDFNRGGEGDDEYQKQYFENLQNSNLAKKRAAEAAKTQEKDAPPGAGGVNGEEHEAPPQQQEQPPRTTEQIAALKKQRYNTWENSEMSTNMWKIISSNSLQSLKDWMAEDPSAVFCRSEDGRGPMWWAFENRRQEMVKIFMDAGVPHTDKDAKGMSPVDLLEGTGGSS